MENNITLICDIHGESVNNASRHLHGMECRECVLERTQSFGVSHIENLLKDKNIVFEKEKMFDNMVYIRKLRADFYLKKYKLIIEFDGAQHFIINKFMNNEEDFRKNMLRDLAKDKYCLKYKVNLLRIPYILKTEKISQIIEDVLESIENNNAVHISYEYYNETLEYNPDINSLSHKYKKSYNISHCVEM